MRVRTIITIHDSITQRDAARLASFMLKLAPVIVEPTVEKDELNDYVRVRWFTTQGTVVEAAAMWFPMLLGCWVHINRTLESADIAEIRVREER